MNKYIKLDIYNSENYMKVAIMNALHDIDSGEETKIDLGPNISYNLFYKCLVDSGWKEIDEMETNGWKVDFFTKWISPSGINVYISGSLYQGLNYKIEVQ